MDLRPKGVDGSRVERVLELAHIAANKNTVPVRQARTAHLEQEHRLTRCVLCRRFQGDVSALVPGGLRMGAPALTTRGFNERDFKKVRTVTRSAAVVSTCIAANVCSCGSAAQVAEFVDRAVKITQQVKEKTGSKLKDFRAYLDANEVPELVALKHEVEDYAKQFPTIGFEKATMRYRD